MPEGHGLDGLAQGMAGETFPDIDFYVGKSKGARPLRNRREEVSQGIPRQCLDPAGHKEKG